MNIYTKAESMIAEHKDMAEQTAYATLQECLKDNTFHNLHTSEQSLIIEISKKEYNKQNTKTEQLALQKIKADKEKRLTKLGYKSGDLTPHYHCPICHDTGKTESGRCKCFYQVVSRLLLEECGLNGKNLPTFSASSFDRFDKSYQADIKKLYDTAKKFIDKLYETNREYFVLCGLSGTGKTYLAECMVSYAIEKYIPTYYVSSFTFNNEMLAYHCAKLDDKPNIMAKYLDPDLLVIDDLGTETILKNVTLEYLYLILNDRASSHKKTVITTNLFPDDILARYEERIFSRLTNQKDAIFVEMKANNLRHTK